MSEVVQVAVAIITKPNGEYLLASRPDGKGWAGWWEFPGGKVEKNEFPEEALSRELQEELGVTPTQVQPWVKRRYDYPTTHDDEAKTVLLHFYFVLDWLGEPAPLEGQTLAWQHPQKLNVSPVLPANKPIMHALSLPNIYAISNAEKIGQVAFLNALQEQLQQGVVKLVLIREKKMDRKMLLDFSISVHALTKQYGASVLIDSDVGLAAELSLDGVHLSRQSLLQLKSKPIGLLVAASCHNELELKHAQELGLDFVTLSSEGVTLSSPEKPIDWGVFEDLAANTTIPLYAVTGPESLSKALSKGARGIAVQGAL